MKVANERILLSLVIYIVIQEKLLCKTLGQYKN
jgi:hypothetical protein